MLEDLTITGLGEVVIKLLRDPASQMYAYNALGSCKAEQGYTLQKHVQRMVDKYLGDQECSAWEERDKRDKLHEAQRGVRLK